MRYSVHKYHIIVTAKVPIKLIHKWILSEHLSIPSFAPKNNTKRSRCTI